MNILSGIGCGIIPIGFALVREYNDFYKCSDVASGITNTIGKSSAFVMQWLMGILIDYNWENRNGGFDEHNERDYNVNKYSYYTEVNIEY